MKPSKGTSSESNCFQCWTKDNLELKNFLALENVRAAEHSHIDFTMGDILDGGS